MKKERKYKSGSIAGSLTGRMALLMVVCAIIIMSFSYRVVSQNVVESSQRYAKMLLSVYGDMMCYETEQEHIPIDLNYSSDADFLGDYFCKWYNVDYVYLYAPDVENGTITVLSFSCDEKLSGKFNAYRGDTIVGSVVNYKLSADELALWNGEMVFAVLDAALVPTDVEIEYLVKDSFGNKVILGGAVSNEDIKSQIQSRIITVAIVFFVIIALAIAIFHLLISRKASLPAKNISKALEDYMKGGQRSKVRLNEKGYYEFAMISEAFNRMSDDIDRYMTDNEKLSREQERQSAEIDIAASIQNGLLPAREALIGNCRIHSGMKPAKYIGGDLYDYIRIDDNHTMAVVADVSGKGMSASMFMAVTLTLIRQFARLGHSPASILGNVNSTLSEENPKMMFVTAFIAIYDSENHTVTYANAGHNQPYVISNRLIRLDGTPGSPLGLFPDEQYTDVSVPMNVGDTLLLYTDGVNEAANEKGEFFGTERLENVLAASFGVSNPARRVYDAVRAFVGNAEQNDDITMLSLMACDNAPIALDYDIREFQKIKSLIMDSGMPDKFKLDLCVAAEECFVNICSYAFDGKVPEGEKILFSLEYSNQAVLRFVDGGRQFDPRKNMPSTDEYDIDTRVGGLGRFIAFTVADSVDYEYTDGKNILTISKTLMKQ